MTQTEFNRDGNPKANVTAPSKNKPRKTGCGLFVLAVLLIIIIFLHQGTTSINRKSPAVPVVLAQAKTQDVPIYLNALGGVVPTASVTVQTQINGLLMQVLFKEGQMVKKGDVLAMIDDRPYQAQLLQYQGQLIRDKALLENAHIDLKRYEKLWKQKSVAQQTLATQQTLVKQLEGTVKIDEGQIAATEVNITYTKITSPIDGRVGLRLVDPGNFVQTSNTNGIAVLNMLNPITVIFTLPEDNISEILQSMAENKTLKVEAYDRQQKTLLDTGELLTIDNQVDPSTGTVRLRAQFDNKKNQLFPNQFVNVRFLVKVLQQATIVPTAAIQYDAKGNSYVYLVNDNKTVSAKPVTVGVNTGENSVILNGISTQQSVVIEGADKLSDGMSIIVSNSDDPPASKPTGKSHRRA